VDFGFKFLNQRTPGSMCSLGKSEPKKMVRAGFWVFIGEVRIKEPPVLSAWKEENQRTTSSGYLGKFSESSNRWFPYFGATIRIKEPLVPILWGNNQDKRSAGSHTLWQQSE
jgi:hypothetical protein